MKLTVFNRDICICVIFSCQRATDFPFQSWQEMDTLGPNQVIQGLIVMEEYNLKFGTATNTLLTLMWSLCFPNVCILKMLSSSKQHKIFDVIKKYCSVRQKNIGMCMCS